MTTTVKTKSQNTIDSKPFLTPEQRPILRKMYDDRVSKEKSWQKLTDNEFDLFVTIVERTRLDPMARQIYPMKRWSDRDGMATMTTQTSIDGFRLIAQRSGEYQGQTHPMWCGPDGVWKDVWLDSKPPFACQIGVYRKGFTEPCYAVARWTSYAITGAAGMMWTKMSDLMLAKCAEALALRKAFPMELSNIYVEEEMEQAADETIRGPKTAEYTPEGVKTTVPVPQAATPEAPKANHPPLPEAPPPPEPAPVTDAEAINRHLEEERQKLLEQFKGWIIENHLTSKFVLKKFTEGKMIEGIEKIDDLPAPVLRLSLTSKLRDRLLATWKDENPPKKPDGVDQTVKNRQYHPENPLITDFVWNWEDYQFTMGEFAGKSLSEIPFEKAKSLYLTWIPKKFGGRGISEEAFQLDAALVRWGDKHLHGTTQ